MLGSLILHAPFFEITRRFGVSDVGAEDRVDGCIRCPCFDLRRWNDPVPSQSEAASAAGVPACTTLRSSKRS